MPSLESFSKQDANDRRFRIFNNTPEQINSLNSESSKYFSLKIARFQEASPLDTKLLVLKFFVVRPASESTCGIDMGDGGFGGNSVPEIYLR